MNPYNTNPYNTNPYNPYAYSPSPHSQAQHGPNPYNFNSYNTNGQNLHNSGPNAYSPVHPMAYPSNPYQHEVPSSGTPPVASQPSSGQLLQAAKEFSTWVMSVAPGARLFVCGGLALALHGNPRSTTDADMAIDLSQTRRENSHRPYDTNALKGFAQRDSQRFIVGPKIFWILNRGTPGAVAVQVDFVDAGLFWAPFQAETMLDPPSQILPIATLNLQTLLVSKMKSAIERSQNDPALRKQKQVNDVTDFCFALISCLKNHAPLAPIHMQHLGYDRDTSLHVVGEFWDLARSLEMAGLVDMHGQKRNWKALIVNSDAPVEYVDGIIV